MYWVNPSSSLEIDHASTPTTAIIHSTQIVNRTIHLKVKVQKPMKAAWAVTTFSCIELAKMKFLAYQSIVLTIHVAVSTRFISKSEKCFVLSNSTFAPWVEGSGPHFWWNHAWVFHGQEASCHYRGKKITRIGWQHSTLLDKLLFHSLIFDSITRKDMRFWVGVLSVICFLLLCAGYQWHTSINTTEPMYALTSPF